MFTIRLWHYKLLPVLPDKMLVAEWRECLAIKRQWEKGTLKHRLVSYVKNWNKGYFGVYVALVVSELAKRNIKFQDKYLDEFKEFCQNDLIDVGVRYKEHNDRYLKQCLYNLQEKYDRGIITEEEWERVLEGVINNERKL